MGNERPQIAQFLTGQQPQRREADAITQKNRDRFDTASARGLIDRDGAEDNAARNNQREFGQTQERERWNQWEKAGGKDAVERIEICDEKARRTRPGIERQPIGRS